MSACCRRYLGRRPRVKAESVPALALACRGARRGEEIPPARRLPECLRTIQEGAARRARHRRGGRRGGWRRGGGCGGGGRGGWRRGGGGVGGRRGGGGPGGGRLRRRGAGGGRAWAGL